MKSLEDRIRAMIRQVVSHPPEHIPLESTLSGDLGLDSIASMELLSMIDEQLDLQIEMEETIGVTTVAGVVALARRQLEARAATP